MTRPKKPDPTKVAAATMLGDLMKLCTDAMKHQPDIWAKMSEAKQQRLIENFEFGCKAAIKKCVSIIASGDMPTVMATIDQVVFKDGVKVVLRAQRDSPEHHLADHAGHSVLIVIPSAEDLLGGAENVKADPDQPGLGVVHSDTED